MSSNITVTMPNDKGEPEAKRTREACLNCRSVRLLFSRHSQMPLLTTDPDERKHVAPVGVRRILPSPWSDLRICKRFHDFHQRESRPSRLFYIHGDSSQQRTHVSARFDHRCTGTESRAVCADYCACIICVVLVILAYQPPGRPSCSGHPARGSIARSI
jgi:hypothetical protein